MNLKDIRDGAVRAAAVAGASAALLMVPVAGAHAAGNSSETAVDTKANQAAIVGQLDRSAAPGVSCYW